MKPHSGIYTGWLRHRRFSPKEHAFRYRVFMMYLDLSEINALFERSWLWSNTKPALAQFKRADFYGDPKLPLDTALRQRVLDETGRSHTGPIRLLANLRYFGYIINPISCYYFYSEDEQLQYILAEVNNTPWDERHSYLLRCDPNQKIQHLAFNKAFHVSPFNPMDIEYDWRSNKPHQKIFLNMQNHRQKRIEFDATLVLKRTEITTASLRSTILKYPFMTLKVLGGIYWEAIKIWRKKIPVYNHPKKTNKGVSTL